MLFSDTSTKKLNFCSVIYKRVFSNWKVYYVLAELKDKFSCIFAAMILSQLFYMTQKIFLKIIINVVVIQSIKTKVVFNFLLVCSIAKGLTIVIEIYTSEIKTQTFNFNNFVINITIGF